MRASILLAATLLAGLPLVSAQHEESGTGSTASADCVSAVTLVGRDDMRWYRDGTGEANPRILGLCPGTQVTFTIVAEGSIPHNFQVDGDGAPPSTDVIVDGETAEYRWTTPASGTFGYVCPIHGRAMSGIVGVGDGAAPPMPPEPMPAHPVPHPPSAFFAGPGLLVGLIPLLGPLLGLGAWIAAYAGAWF